MATLRVTLQVDVDGVPATWLAPNGRIVRSYTVDESQSFSYDKVDDDGTAAALPTSQIGTVQNFILVPEASMEFYIDGSATPITIGANGVLMALGATIDAGATTNLTVSNDSGGTALVKGIVAGT